MTAGNASVRYRLHELARAANDVLPHDADDPRFDRTAAFVAFAVALDFVTTTIIFLEPGLAEANEFLSTLASVHVAIALAFNLGYGVLLFGTYAFVAGWLGRVAAALSVPSVIAGANNTVYALNGGSSPAYEVFGPYLHHVLAYGIPIFGLLVGTTWHLAHDERLPWRVVGGTLLAVFASFGVGAVVV